MNVNEKQDGQLVGRRHPSCVQTPGKAPDMLSDISRPAHNQSPYGEGKARSQKVLPIGHPMLKVLCFAVVASATVSGALTLLPEPAHAAYQPTRCVIFLNNGIEIAAPNVRNAQSCKRAAQICWNPKHVRSYSFYPNGYNVYFASGGRNQNKICNAA